MVNVAEEIYNKYKTNIYNYFYRSTLNNHISEELTQDTFLKAFKYINSFRGESSIKTWLFKIARNIFINYIRKNGNIDEDISNYNLADSNDAFSEANEKMLITEILFKLSEEERTLILLRDLNGFTYSEISDILSFTEGQVKIGLHRARKKFRSLYNNEWREEQI